MTGVAVDESGVPGDWASGDVLVATGGARGGVVDVLPAVAGGSEPPAGGVHQLLGVCMEGAVCAPGGPGFEAFKGLNAVAVDQANGEVFVVDDNREVDMFMPVGLGGEYEFVGHLAPPGGFAGQALGVVVDGGAVDGGDVFVWEAGAVDEFALAGGGLGGGLLERLRGVGASVFAHVSSVAVDAVSHRVFVGDDRGEEGGVVDVLGEDLVVPDVRVAPAGGVSATTGVLHGTVNPDGAGEAGCVFEYGTSAGYGQSVECEGTGSKAHPVPNVSTEEPVSAKVEGLAPGTTYFYRLAASNHDGANVGTCPGDCGQFQTTGPNIASASAALVTATSVSLHATINPDGAATGYFFQYGRTSSYEAQAPATASALGAGVLPVVAPAVHVAGLAAGTVYHYRVVAVSEVEVSPGVVELHDFVGADEAFTTQGAAAVGLADGRGWEMVSPPVKEGALIETIDAAGGSNGDVIQAAMDGAAFTYVTDAPTEPQPQGNTGETQVFSTRTPTGWRTHDLTVAHLTATDAAAGPGNEYRFFSEDLSAAIVQPFGAFDPAISAEASEAGPFLHSDYLNADPLESCVGGCYRPLVTGKEGFANVPPGTRFGLGSVNGKVQPCPPVLICGPEFVGASSDAGHVVLSSIVALTEAAPAESLYEWGSVGGMLTLVSVLPEDEGGAPVGGATLGDGNADARNAVSGDGSRVFFSTFEPLKRALYMRDVAAGRTVRVDVGGVSGHADAHFQDATSDGERVWFTDTQRLTVGSGARSNAPDLYECRVTVSGCQLMDLTPKNAGGEVAGVQGAVLGVSDDGGWVYFVATGVLENTGGVAVAGAVAGAANLYVRHEGITRLVAVLSGEDSPDWGGGVEAGKELTVKTSQVSANGEWLVFMSELGLTGYDTRDARSGHADEEVYVYDAGSGRVLCVSCNPSGARPVGSEYGEGGENMRVVGGDRIWEASSWLAALVPGWTPFRLGTARYQSRYVSDSGRVFFDARDSLVAQAVNENWDVYEWEPVGVPAGSTAVCSGMTVGFSVSTGGCVALVSSGESPDESAFLDASATGGDVFFMTTARLSGLDVDDSYDVYDAHECTVLSPCLSQPSLVPPACTTAEACRAAPSPQPSVFGVPPSATFSGPGNLAAKRAVARGRRVLTRAQKLSRALGVCRRMRVLRRRAGCERAARRRYRRRARARRLHARQP